jgi:hypothetical protein
MNPSPKTRFYQVRVPKRSEWARIWITDDGCISILSDYGDFGYWFGSPGCEFRRFLTRCGPDYLMSKFKNGEEEFDENATRRNAQEMVLRARREREIDKETARDEWDAVCNVDWSDEYSRSRWYFEETKLVDCATSDVLEFCVPMQVQMFVKEIWPLFVAQLQAELDAESASAHPGFTD